MCLFTIFIIVVVVAIALVAYKLFFFVSSQESGSNRDYFIPLTPCFYYFGKPLKILAFEMDGQHIYVSVRVKRGIVIHFHTSYDYMWNLNSQICCIEKWGNMYMLNVDWFGKGATFRNSADIVKNFNISAIKNYKNMGINEQNFQKIKNALILAAQHVEAQSSKKLLFN